jgi:ABC-2 type transport system permease protein
MDGQSTKLEKVLISDSTQWIVVSPKRTIITALVELFNSRSVLYALVKRDIRSRYRASFFGFTWALAKPMIQLSLFYLVMGNFLGAGRSVEYFAIYIFVGLLVWGVIQESWVAGSSSITSAAGLVTKVSFPREILPIATVVVACFNALIQIPILVLGYLVIGKFPNLVDFWIAIPLLVSLLSIALAGALVFSALNVFARDVQHLVDLISMVLMYLSPVIYSWVFVYEYVVDKFNNDLIFRLYMSNPITQIIVGFQEILWPGNRINSSGEIQSDYIISNLSLVFILMMSSIIALFAGYSLFLRNEAKFAREL